MNSKNHIRAVRYRQLALAEPDRAKADVLLKIADEAGLITTFATNQSLRPISAMPRGPKGNGQAWRVFVTPSRASGRRTEPLRDHPCRSRRLIRMLPILRPPIPR
jgi:hypothetical protein